MGKKPIKKIGSENIAVLKKKIASQVQGENRQSASKTTTPTAPVILSSSNTNSVNPISFHRDTFKGGGIHIESATSSLSGQFVLDPWGITGYSINKTSKIFYYDARTGQGFFGGSTAVPMFGDVTGSTSASRIGHLLGDVTGNLTANKVIALQGTSVGVGLPLSGNVLTYDASVTQWVPRPPQISVLQDVTTGSINDVTAGAQQIHPSVTIPANTIQLGDTFSFMLVNKTTAIPSSTQNVRLGFEFNGNTILLYPNAWTNNNTSKPWHFFSLLGYAVSAVNANTMTILFSTFTGSVDFTVLADVNETALSLNASNQIGVLNVPTTSSLDWYFTGQFTGGNLGMTLTHILAKSTHSHAGS